MGKDSGDKTRKERRKEARLEKNKKKFDSWIQHHKTKRTMSNQKAETEFYMDKKHKRTVSSRNDDDQVNASLEPMGKKKTKFGKYLEPENASVEDDIRLERKLAKKLKVENGKLRRGDALNVLFEGIPSVFDSWETEENTELETVNANNHLQAPVMEKHAKYLPPQLKSMSRNESEEHSHIRKRVRGLLNRLGESNVERITKEIFSIFQSISLGNAVQIVSEEILTSCSVGPRGNEQYAAVFAALVSGLACLVGIDFGAKLLASLAKCFEDEYQKEDNLSLRNLTLLLCYLYIFEVCSSDLIYDYMMMLSSSLTEVDVSTILTVLNCCGMRLRSDDPSAMKTFIVSIQNKVTELQAASRDTEGITESKRMEFMLETILDIKSNKKKAKEDTLQHTHIKKWLQKLRVENGLESVLVQGLKWSRLLDPEITGHWWLSGEMMASTASYNNIENIAKKKDKESSETKKMLQLAAGQKMNTGPRRAIFYIIMYGEDYIDAFEKLLRLDLPGKQDREIIRVLVECCLQEKEFNKYYCVLASKLCNYDKNHKFTLQYCIWDHYTELESMQLLETEEVVSMQEMRSANLAKFIAEMMSSFTLSLAVLKKADLHDTRKLTSTKIKHYRKFFEAVFEYTDNLVWNIFKRVGKSPQYEALRTGIKFFIERYVVGNQNQFAGKYKVAKKALESVEEEDPFL